MNFTKKKKKSGIYSRELRGHLEMKTCSVRTSVDGPDSRLVTTEYRIEDLRARSTENTHLRWRGMKEKAK